MGEQEGAEALKVVFSLRLLASVAANYPCFLLLVAVIYCSYLNGVGFLWGHLS